MVFRSRILICFQKPQDLLQKSDVNEDDEEDDEDDDDEEDDEDVDDGFWKQNTNLLPMSVCLYVCEFRVYWDADASKNKQSRFRQIDQMIES